jgi:pyruvate ferredoxin oxidoreductase alpha subunit
MALAGSNTIVRTVIAGLGGRAITRTSLRSVIERAERDELEPLTFLDLNRNLIDRHLAREAQTRRSGPAAEALLRDIGVIAASIG